MSFVEKASTLKVENPVHKIFPHFQTILSLTTGWSQSHKFSNSPHTVVALNCFVLVDSRLRTIIYLFILLFIMDKAQYIIAPDVVKSLIPPVMHRLTK